MPYREVSQIISCFPVTAKYLVQCYEYLFSIQGCHLLVWPLRVFSYFATEYVVLQNIPHTNSKWFVSKNAFAVALILFTLRHMGKHEKMKFQAEQFQGLRPTLRPTVGIL